MTAVALMVLILAAAFTTVWATAADRRARTCVHPETETLAVAAAAWIISRVLLTAAVVASAVAVLKAVL